eukprot:COSAG02_NODE_3343_length_6898_cov_9.593617_5_plen_115_part_00
MSPHKNTFMRSAFAPAEVMSCYAYDFNTPDFTSSGPSSAAGMSVQVQIITAQMYLRCHHAIFLKASSSQFPPHACVRNSCVIAALRAGRASFATMRRRGDNGHNVRVGIAPYIA